jgi:hypothetical protein
MPNEVRLTKPRICPNCGKEIPKLPKRPRDLSLLLHVLLYRVPLEAEITEAWIEKVRTHCRMKPERLVELRAGHHARHWPRMIERRAARRAFFIEHGKLPPRWMGLLPGEPDHDAALAGFRRYRKGGLAKIKARLRKHPDTVWEKLTKRYLSTKRIHSLPRKSAALDDVGARLAILVGAQAGKLKLKEFEALKAGMFAGNVLPKRSRMKTAPRTGLDAGSAGLKERGEPAPNVLQRSVPGRAGPIGQPLRSANTDQSLPH